jgi:hypothetical protein
MEDFYDCHSEIRHELFELPIAPVELFVSGGSSQQMIDSISIGKLFDAPSF